MKKNIILIILSLIWTNFAYAECDDLGPIIQRQSQQIQELRVYVAKLEKHIIEIQDKLAKNNIYVESTDSKKDGRVGESSDYNNNYKKNEITKRSQSYNAPNPGSSDEKNTYDIALAYLKNNRLEEAQNKFEDFIHNYPNSSYISNACFWYSETYYRMGNFNKAAINYLQTYKKFPKAIKAPDSLLKLAYSLASLNKTKESCSMLNKLDEEFPDRTIDSIKMTEEARSKFNCK